LEGIPESRIKGLIPYIDGYTLRYKDKNYFKGIDEPWRASVSIDILREDIKKAGNVWLLIKDKLEQICLNGVYTHNNNQKSNKNSKGVSEEENVKITSSVNKQNSVYSSNKGSIISKEISSEENLKKDSLEEVGFKILSDDCKEISLIVPPFSEYYVPLMGRYIKSFEVISGSQDRFQIKVWDVCNQKWRIVNFQANEEDLCEQNVYVLINRGKKSVYVKAKTYPKKNIYI
jgi:hypothetical protein